MKISHMRCLPIHPCAPRGEYQKIKAVVAELEMVYADAAVAAGEFSGRKDPFEAALAEFVFQGTSTRNPAWKTSGCARGQKCSFKDCTAQQSCHLLLVQVNFRRVPWFPR